MTPWVAVAKTMSKKDLDALWSRAYSHLSPEELQDRIRQTASVLKISKPTDYRSSWAPANM